MRHDRYRLLGDWLALAIVAVACPASLLGGSLLTCTDTGALTADCAAHAINATPYVMLGAGAISGVITRGWTGLFAIFVGTVLGMTAILLLSFVGDRPVPVDVFSGVIATIWFFGPTLIGYTAARAVMHAWRFLRDRLRTSRG